MKILSFLFALSLLPGSALAVDLNGSMPALSGYAELFGGKFVVESKSEKHSLAGATGSANANFDQRWNVQADVTYDSLNFAGSKVSGFGAAAHVYWRDPLSFALGGFATVSKARWAVVGNKINIANQWTAGLEAQAYLEKITLYGQVWAGKSQTFSNPALNQIGARMAARYYISENLRLDGEVSYTSSTKDLVRDSNAVAATQINYRLEAVPVTLFGRFQWEQHHTNSISPNATTVKKLFVGLRFSFGSNSLKDEERNGAAMDIYRPNLPVIPQNVYAG